MGSLSVFFLAALSFRFIKNNPQTENKAGDLIFILSLSSLFFVFLSSVGRVCQSTLAGQVSRYMPYAVTGIFALYLSAMNLKKNRHLKILIPLLIFLSLPLNFKNDTMMRRKFVDSKKALENCLKIHPDQVECEDPAAQELPLYPNLNDASFLESFRLLKNTK